MQKNEVCKKGVQNMKYAKKRGMQKMRYTKNLVYKHTKNSTPTQPLQKQRSAAKVCNKGLQKMRYEKKTQPLKGVCKKVKK